MQRPAKLMVPVLVMLAAVGAAFAQSGERDPGVPAPRALGPIVGRSARTFVSVTRLITIGGVVFVHDARAREGQLWLLDSSLTSSRLVLDPAEGALRRFRGDSALFHPIDVTINGPALRGSILTVAGTVARSAMIPQRDYVGCDVGDMDNTGWQSCAEPTKGDSSLIMAVHFAKWDVDTIGRFATEPRTAAPNGAWPVIGAADAWTLFRDGTLAIARADDYHIELVTPQRAMTQGPRAPFVWRRLTDMDRERLLDSARSADQAAPRQYAAADDWPSHWPPFRGPMMVDEDERIWVDERQPPGGDTVSVYGIFDRNGRFMERVKVPASQSVLGFGAGGIVYLGVVEGGRTAIAMARFR
jgi:hypothetical protein